MRVQYNSRSSGHFSSLMELRLAAGSEKPPEGVEGLCNKEYHAHLLEYKRDGGVQAIR